MTDRTSERRGNQILVEYEDSWTGESIQEWRHDPIRMCACGRKEIEQCEEIQVTTFTETYACGYVYRYNNTNGYNDNLISIKGRRIK